jgi:hypothetical protein
MICYTPATPLGGNDRQRGSKKMTIFDQIIAIIEQVLQVSQVLQVLLQILSIFGIAA